MENRKISKLFIIIGILFVIGSIVGLIINFIQSEKPSEILHSSAQEELQESGQLEFVVLGSKDIREVPNKNLIHDEPSATPDVTVTSEKAATQDIYSETKDNNENKEEEKTLLIDYNKQD